MSDIVKSFRKIGLRLARPDILFWLTPFLILLLVLGTIAQKNIGIFASQETYFSSFYFMLGFIPLPGGITLIGLLFINLLAKFLFKSPWSWAKAGTIVTHFGVLVLILGGLVSYTTSREGYLLVPQGETRNMIEDYHQRELVIRDDTNILLSIPHDELRDGLTVTSPAIPFTMTITRYCFNCEITRRPTTDQDGWVTPGKFMQLNAKPSDPQDEKNMTGIEFEISGKKYLTFDKFPKPPQMKIAGKQYTIAIERTTRALPFSITLKKFKEDFHPGTDMAKAYKSMVTITDGKNTWPATIEMNEPLRYRGFTFYQSSFDTSGEIPYTVLAVVENKGRIFPYLATIIMAVGLILHLCIRLSGKGGSRV